MTYDEILQENCNQMIPTKWNLYKWAKNHPKTTIAHALKRMEKIFDHSDSIYFGFSGGKDSSVTAHLALMELNLRKLRVKNGIDRDGNHRVDPLDKKWESKRLSAMMTDAEVVFSFTNDYAKRFLQEYGPMGMNLLEFNWYCLPMSWQSGVSFDSGVLISWDEEKKSQWVQPMPTKEQLFGFENINMENLKTANPVALSSLHSAAQEWHRMHGNVFQVKRCDLFAWGSKFDPYWQMNKEKDPNEPVDAVANFGRGPINFVTKAEHEKEFQDDYSYWYAQTSWLVSDLSDKMQNAVSQELSKRYDLSKDVWFMKAVDLDDSFIMDGMSKNAVSTALISLRAEESLDRRVILSQGEYSTGQYSNNQGVNVCSPVFDFTVRDIWRIISAADWDINDVYERLYEIGVAPADQRVGSLLNYAAVRSISTVKALEPELYARINARFQNVEFMAQFSRAGYYKIGKPKDTHWDGKNHIKAGVSLNDLKELSDKYEYLLKKLEIPYERNGNEFSTGDPKLKGKPWFPLKPYIL